MIEKAVCTIITKSYLPYARTLASSLAEHNPDVNLYVLLADRVDGYFDSSLEPFNFIYLEDLADTHTIEQMCFYYTPFELCCALRGALHDYMYQNKIAQKWLFLDSDILIYNSLDAIFQKLEKASILINPHITSPLNQKHVESIEASILVSGLYNAGFLGLSLSEETSKFIQWFKDRLVRYSFNRRGKGISGILFVDQLWLNFVPHFFENVEYLILSGANVAYWNLISGKISNSDSGYLFNGEPLLFIHFTGWDISQPSRVSTYLDEDVDLWQQIGENYQNMLLKNGYEECEKYPYAFSSFTNGQIITSDMRYSYYELISSNAASTVNPFSEEYYLIDKQLRKSNKPTVLSDFKILLKNLLGLS
jgi:lipopolysaccharide biosynthesis glycosyltransferase